MKTRLKNLIILTLLTVCTLVFAPSAFALGEKTTLTVTTVIDNAPTGFSSQYTADRIYKMTNTSKPANAPSTTSTKPFVIADGQSQTISFDYRDSTKCNADTYWFKANQYTDKHLSLSTVVYNEDNNLKAYTYRPNGTLSSDNATNPYNWVEVINSAAPASVTLHFVYNPDIGSLAPDPDPAPSYSKTIDYLGDGVVNPDTTVSGINDYRLSLDLLTQEAPEDNKADIVFVLDVSGSMGDKLSSGQTKMAILKATMTQAINDLTGNPNNRISIIKFSSDSSVLIQSSSDKDKLNAVITGLSANGYTNYYDALSDTMAQVDKMIGSDTLNRDKVVIFLTDGEPTYATPVAQTTSVDYYSSMVYGCQAASKMSNIDKFYSIFIGDNSGSASMLQSLTQMITVSDEKFMVQATSAAQLTDTITRFTSKMSNSLYNVTVTDGLSAYVNYTGSMNVTQTTGSNPPVILTAGTDYSLDTTGGVSVRFLNKLSAANKYTVSFNVRSSDLALLEYSTNKDNITKGYPNIGDTGTDYVGNATSSGRAGFYSNTTATLKYAFGASGIAEKAYNKPVVQVVELPPVTPEITLKKVLSGMTLEDDMFTFEVSQVFKSDKVGEEDKVVVLDTVTNKANGEINISDLKSMEVSVPGIYTYTVKEVIPPVAEQIKGMAYDEVARKVIVTVKRVNDTLEQTVEYPNGAQFNNTFTSIPVWVELTAYKKLEGRDLKANEFAFNLLYPDSEGQLVSVDFKKNGDPDSKTNIAPIVFEELEFTKEGVYKYTIQEVIDETMTNITWDENLVIAEITVTDDDRDGKLEAKVTYSRAGTFVNTFEYSTVDATIEVRTILTGMELKADRFKFKITDLPTNPKATNPTGSNPQGNDAAGYIKFNYVYDTAGTYEYNIIQLPESPADSNMKYDTGKTIKVTVVVTADADSGKLTAKASYPTDPNFYNNYKIRGEIR